MRLKASKDRRNNQYKRQGKILVRLINFKAFLKSKRMIYKYGF